MTERETLEVTIQNRIDEARNQHKKVATIFISTLSQILKMMKEQKPVEPEIEGDGRNSNWFVCGECHGIIDPKDKFCRHCGREIKWK